MSGNFAGKKSLELKHLEDAVSAEMLTVNSVCRLESNYGLLDQIS